MNSGTHFKYFIAPLSDIPMFYIRYLAIHKVHMHTGAIRQLLYGYTICSIEGLIAPLSDIPMFYIRYLTIHKVHMHAGAIRQLMVLCMYAR